MRQTALQRAIDMQLAGLLSPRELKLAQYIAQVYHFDTVRDAVELALVWIAQDALREKNEDEYDSLDEEVAEILAGYEDE